MIRSRFIDIHILMYSVILVAMSVSFMYGASARIAETLSLDSGYFFYRQLVYSVFGVFWLVFLSYVKSEFVFRVSPYLFLCVLGLLVLVLIPGFGVERNGARRWIDLGAISLQPSEFAKLFVLLFLSNHLGKKQRFLKQGFLYHFTPVLVVIGVSVVLVFFERDFSTSFVIVLVVIHLCFVVGVRLRYFAYLMLTGVPFLYGVIMYFPYMKARVSYYVGSMLYGGYESFQLKQAFNAIEEAGYFGHGLGIGGFHARIPEAHTDFYFASIVADVGLFGAVFLLGVYCALCVCLFRLSLQFEDRRMMFFTYGVASLFSWQAILNLGSVLGLLPITGLPFPLLSYGGNSLLCFLCALGLVLGMVRTSLR